VVKPERLLDICIALRDEEKTSFRYLSMIAGLDFCPRAPGSGWSITSIPPLPQPVTLKTFLADDAAPVVDSVVRSGPRPTGTNGKSTT